MTFPERKGQHSPAAGVLASGRGAPVGTEGCLRKTKWLNVFLQTCTGWQRRGLYLLLRGVSNTAGTAVLSLPFLSRAN